jgi:hypothetical protein
MAGRPGRPRKVKADPLDEIHEENLYLQAVDPVPEALDADDDVVAEVGEFEDADDAGRFGLLSDEDLYPDPEG